MKKNYLLTIAKACGKITMGALLLVLLGFTVLLVHWQVRPAAYKNVVVAVEGDRVAFSKSTDVVLPSTDDVANKRTSGLKVEIPSSIGSEIYKGAKIPIQDISAFSLYTLAFQFVAGTVLLLLIVRQLLNVISAVQGVQTFHAKSVEAFRKIGYLCLALAALRGFYFFDAEGISRIGFKLEFNTLMCMLAAFILAEIFKEGNKLFEQDQLTI